jgi:hypothetical protein
MLGRKEWHSSFLKDYYAPLIRSPLRQAYIGEILRMVFWRADYGVTNQSRSRLTMYVIQPAERYLRSTVGDELARSISPSREQSGTATN